MEGRRLDFQLEGEIVYVVEIELELEFTDPYLVSIGSSFDEVQVTAQPDLFLEQSDYLLD